MIKRSSAPATILVLGDYTAVDGFALAYGVTRPFHPWRREDLIFGVTGPPVGAEPWTSIVEANRAATRREHLADTLRLKGFLARLRCGEIPVFKGLIHPYTTIKSSQHVDKSLTDIYDDAHSGKYTIDGDFPALIKRLIATPGPIHILAGGPLTEVEKLLKHPIIGPKIDIIAFQGPLFSAAQWGTSELTDRPLGGGNRAFNLAAHPTDALMQHHGRVVYVPTNITRHPELVFNSLEELEALDIHPELLEKYRISNRHTHRKRSGTISIHDLYLAEVLRAVLDQEMDGFEFPKEPHQALLGPFRMRVVEIAHVPRESHERERWGEVDARFYSTSSEPPRSFVVERFSDPPQALLHRFVRRYLSPASAAISNITVDEVAYRLSERFRRRSSEQALDDLILDYDGGVQLPQSWVDSRETMIRTACDAVQDVVSEMAGDVAPGYLSQPTRRGNLYVEVSAYVPVAEGELVVGMQEYGLKLVAAGAEIHLAAPIETRFRPEERPYVYDPRVRVIAPTRQRDYPAAACTQ